MRKITFLSGPLDGLILNDEDMKRIALCVILESKPHFLMPPTADKGGGS